MAKDRKEDDNVKKILLSMYANFSGNFISSDYIKSEIENPFVIQSLVENHYLEPMGEKDYSLGANALPLISAWKTEELTKKITALTILVVILTIIMAMISIIQMLK